MRIPVVSCALSLYLVCSQLDVAKVNALFDPGFEGPCEDIVTERSSTLFHAAVACHELNSTASNCFLICEEGFVVPHGPSIGKSRDSAVCSFAGEEPKLERELRDCTPEHSQCKDVIEKQNLKNSYVAVCSPFNLSDDLCIIRCNEGFILRSGPSANNLSDSVMCRRDTVELDHALVGCLPENDKCYPEPIVKNGTVKCMESAKGSHLKECRAHCNLKNKFAGGEVDKLYEATLCDTRKGVWSKKFTNCIYNPTNQREILPSNDAYGIPVPLFMERSTMNAAISQYSKTRMLVASPLFLLVCRSASTVDH